MKVWFVHDGASYTAEDSSKFESLHVLPVLDKNGDQHLVRWGAHRHDHDGFPRGMWYRQGILKQWGAIWVRIPATKYEQATMYGGLLGVPLKDDLAGALVRVKGVGVRVYLVDSDAPGETTVVPKLFSELS